MPVTLRSPNLQVPPAVLLAQVKAILPGYPTPNTALAAASVSQTGAELIYVRDKFALMNGAFPAVNLRMGRQHRGRSSARTWAGTALVVVEYYNDWTQNASLTKDAISIAIGDDLERMAANLESNETLTNNGTAYAVSIMPPMSMSDDVPYEDTSMQGIHLLFRTLSVTFNLLDYDV